jgi:hypothetical protein
MGRAVPPLQDSGRRPSARAADFAVAGLWAICAITTLPAARNPGFVAHPETVPYPWGAVVGTCIVLTLEALVLRAVLRPARPGRLWLRVLASVAGLAVLLLGVLQLGMTDLPWDSYMPGLFAVLGALLVVAFGLARGVKRFKGEIASARRRPRRPGEY